MLLSLSGLLLGFVAAPAAAPATYAETMAECATLFAPLIGVAQAQRLVADTPLGEAPEVSGNSDECGVEFRPKDWAPDQPGSARPLLRFSVSHGAGPLGSYEQTAALAARMARNAFHHLEQPGEGATRGYIYTAFGSHWKVLQSGDNIVTLQVVERYPAQTLDTLGGDVLKALSAPALREWRERRP